MIVHDGVTVVVFAQRAAAIRLPQTRRQLLLHAAHRLQIQEACMNLATVLPFGQCPAVSVAGACDLVDANRPQLQHLFQRFAGLFQVQLVIDWSEEGVIAHFRDSAELAPLFQGATIAPTAPAHAVSKLAARLSGKVEEALAEVCADIVSLPVAAGTLWNGALLVRADHMDRLTATVEAIDAIWPAGFRIRQIGPAPVASFATLGVDFVGAGAVEAACANRGEDHATTSWRRAALMTLGPDMNDREAVRAQARIIEAADRLGSPRRGFGLLRTYSEGQGHHGAPSLELA